MKNLYGKITASLIDDDLSIPENLIDRINGNISPPEKVTSESVYIRAMYIVSDRVNSFGRCFPSDEHESLADLIIDSPVLVGHRKDSLPIARNFYAERVRRGDANWVKVYFYWLKDAEGAETLKNNIDGGIYKECSISFIFSFPECSICHEDIRKCGHRPFNEYQTIDGQKKETYFNYRQIDKVLETSLVFRGSVHDTSLTNELFFRTDDVMMKSTDNSFPMPSMQRIWDLNGLDMEGRYLVMPAYESLRLLLRRQDDRISVHFYNGQEITAEKSTKYIQSLSLAEGEYALDCRLIGYRGKERQKVSELLKYLEGNKSAVSRIELKIYDLLESSDEKAFQSDIATRRAKLAAMSDDLARLMVPSEVLTGWDILHSAGKLATRFGLEIVEIDSDRKFLYCNRKRASFTVADKKNLGRIFKYKLNGYTVDKNLPVTNAVIAKAEYNIGEILEIGLSAIVMHDDAIEIVHPEIIDSYGSSEVNDSLPVLSDNKRQSISYQTYAVSFYGNGDVLLSSGVGDNVCDYVIRNFSNQKINMSRRFLADTIKVNDRHKRESIGHGRIIARRECNESVILKLDGFFEGTFIVRPVIINHVRRLLFYKVGSDGQNEAGIE